MRDSALHAILEAFTTDAAGRLAAETAGGAEVSFELVEAERRPGHVPLYCYRALTADFIDERVDLLSALPTYAAAVRGLAVVERVGSYLLKHGERRIPGEPRARADLALHIFLRVVYADRSQFEFEPERFEQAYAELEEALYEGQWVTTVIAPLLGLALDDDTRELPLGDGLSLIRSDALDEAPADAAWDERGETQLLAMCAVTHDPSRPPPLSPARTRFRRLLTSLRLFERGGYALGPLAWMRTTNGPWRPVPLGGSGRPGLPVLIGAAQEDELRAFLNLLERRTPANGEVAWALARFEMGAERATPFDALTDYLLALRALLEPEGPGSGRLGGRLAAICAPPDQWSAVVARTTRAISLERDLISGASPVEPDADQLVEELSENLRALLRDLICGHLEPAAVVGLADDLLGEAVPAATG